MGYIVNETYVNSDINVKDSIKKNKIFFTNDEMPKFVEMSKEIN